MNNKKKFLGARMEPEILDIVNKVAEENKVDRTHAMKILVYAGRRGLRLEKAIKLYGEGKASIDKVAKIAGLTISEMMQEVVAHGIKSDETIEEYRQGIKVLMS